MAFIGDLCRCGFHGDDILGRTHLELQIDIGLTTGLHCGLANRGPETLNGYFHLINSRWERGHVKGSVAQGSDVSNRTSSFVSHRDRGAW